jgi:hypothetical protein
MSSCLNEARVRAAADDEATGNERTHLETCASCAARVDAARRAGDVLTAMASSVDVPASLRAGVERALVHRADRSGSTTLRDEAPARRASIWMTAAAATAALLLVFFLMPPLDAPRELSAAEVLDRSLQSFSSFTGTVRREFDLELQLPRVAAVQNGTYRIEQLIDHGESGRYRLIRYAPDGTLLDGISEDPTAGTRTVLVRADNQLYAFRLSIDSARTLAMRDIEKHHVEAMIRVLQTAAGQTVRETGGGLNKRYVVELPEAIGDANKSGLWELTRAKVEVNASDFQIVHASVAGSYMGEPFSMSFRLRSQQFANSAYATPGEFELPDSAGMVAIEGHGSEDLGRDLLVAALRELARARR